MSLSKLLFNSYTCKFGTKHCKFNSYSIFYTKQYFLKLYVKKS